MRVLPHSSGENDLHLLSTGERGDRRVRRRLGIETEILQGLLNGRSGERLGHQTGGGGLLLVLTAHELLVTHGNHGVALDPDGGFDRLVHHLHFVLVLIVVKVLVLVLVPVLVLVLVLAVVLVCVPVIVLALVLRIVIVLALVIVIVRVLVFVLVPVLVLVVVLVLVLLLVRVRVLVLVLILRLRRAPLIE